MDNIFDVRGFNVEDESHLATLNAEITCGYRFDNLTDFCNIARELVKADNEMTKYLYNRLISEDVLDSRFFLNKEHTCPICGSPTVSDNEDYENLEDYCIICDYVSNQFLNWEEIRECNHDVLIWSAHFNNNSVCNELALEHILRRLYDGSTPDTIRYKKKIQYEFVDSFMNDNVVNHRMSEYEKFENTMLMVQFNSNDDKVKSLANTILTELRKLNKSEYTDVKEVEAKDLVRMSLNI